MADIKLKHVYKKYDNGVIAVNDFCLDIEDGEFVVFVGPSGCGKSTTLRMIAGLEKISEGELYIGGKCVNDVKAADRDVAFVFQNYALYPHMSVAENIGYSLKIAGIPKKERREEVVRIAKMLDLEKVLDRKPRELSGGQKQRVAMGRAIIRHPQVFLMDEPLSNLDAKLRTKMRYEIKKLHKMLNTTTVYVTHDQTEAMTLGTRIAIMKDGIIQQVATPEELYSRPANTFVAQFIGVPQMNLIDAKVILKDDKGYLRIDRCTNKAEQNVSDKNSKIEIALDDAETDRLREKGYIGEEVIIGIRPEDIIVSDKGEFETVVGVYELLGAEGYVYFDYKDRKMSARIPGAIVYTVGQKIRFSLRIDRISMFDSNRKNRI